MQEIETIILAAGKGSRMKSNIPKVLHVLGDSPLLGHVLEAAKNISKKIHVVYGHGGDQVKSFFNDEDINWILQEQQLGTGHAVREVIPHIKDHSRVLILYGDVPLITHRTLKLLLNESIETGFSILTCILENPKGYGRIIRDKNGQIESIVEEKDASEEQKKVKEINTGIMSIRSDLLKEFLPQIKSNNAQNEIYLTDIVDLVSKSGRQIKSVTTSEEYEVSGVNDKKQLSELERIHQLNQADQFMHDGLLLRDATRFDCRGELSFGQDCEIDINCIFSGKVTLGSNVKIGPNCIINNCSIDSNVQILPNTMIENSNIGAGSSIGPFARIRPETTIGENAKIGNFVEVKKSSIGESSKVSHLSYIGDSNIGDDVNIGAGVITCNYDGTNKHPTHIGDGSFIGSNCELVAPINIGKNSVIGAGSTITKDVPEGSLGLSRSKQSVIANWKKKK